jgi:molecular chaperone DnaK (HSP70)
MIIVGIDLGTSNTSICYYKDGKCKFIRDQNNHNISSVISITKYGNVFGNQAKRIKDNNVFISNLKRLIGYKYTDLKEDYYKQFPYKITASEDNNIQIEITEKYSVDELMTYFLSYLKVLIDNELKEDYKVIVTVPAYFTIHQKEVINNCVKNANFNCIKLLNEPTAAAISYGSFLTFASDENILVFDLGGGTLDLSIINITTDDDKEFVYEVIGTYGNNKCGGSDLTFLLIDYIKAKYENCSFSNNIFEHVDQMKIELNNLTDANEVWRNNIATTNDSHKHIDVIITKEEFDTIVNIWLEGTGNDDVLGVTVNISSALENVLSIAKCRKENISHVLLVGGATKLVQIRTLLEDYFQLPLDIYHVNNIRIEDVAVSHGSALHGHITNSSKNIVLVDVCPFTIGIETMDGIMSPIINRNSTIPISRTQQFTTFEDDMTSVSIKVYQGESRLVANNIYLGNFTLSGLTKAAKGVPVINVNIMIDHSGLLRITACDRKKFTMNQITISAKDYKMSDDESAIIRDKMLQNKDNENILFDLIDVYNNLLMDFEKFVFNLVINPINNFAEEYVEDIKETIRPKIIKICKCIKIDLKGPISFDQFELLVSELYGDLIIDDEPLTYSNILVYLKLLLLDLRNYIMDNHMPLISVYDDKNYDKGDNDKGADVSDENIGVTDKIDKMTGNLMSTDLASLLNGANDQVKAANDVKLYELVELLQSLLTNIDILPIDINGRDKLMKYIDEVSEGIKREELEKYNVDEINNYCENLYNEHGNDQEED